MARPTDRYSIVSITLHWLMLVLVALAYLTMELDDLHIRGLAIESWHFTFGLSVLALIWLRVLAILIWKPPAAPTEHKLARQGALLMHVALYAFMIGMPVAGWIAAGEEGEIIRFFGIVIPPLLSGSETFGELGEDAHEVGASIGYVLVCLHSFAALFHHFVLRDRVLKRMLPIR